MRFKSEELTIRFDLSSFNKDIADLGEKLAVLADLGEGLSEAMAALSRGGLEMREALTPARLPLRAIRLRA
jgi:hypothetical protein